MFEDTTAPSPVFKEALENDDVMRQLASRLRAANPSEHTEILMDEGVELDDGVEVIVQELLADYPEA